MEVGRIRPHFFEIDVGAGFILDVFGPPSLTDIPAKFLRAF
jgi:hypothetical protein